MDKMEPVNKNESNFLFCYILLFYRCWPGNGEVTSGDRAGTLTTAEKIVAEVTTAATLLQNLCSVWLYFFELI